jgi:hypothetical protein
VFQKKNLEKLTFRIVEKHKINFFFLFPLLVSSCTLHLSQRPKLGHRDVIGLQEKLFSWAIIELGRWCVLAPGLSGVGAPGSHSATAASCLFSRFSPATAPSPNLHRRGGVLHPGRLDSSLCRWSSSFPSAVVGEATRARARPTN